MLKWIPRHLLQLAVVVQLVAALQCVAWLANKPDIVGCLCLYFHQHHLVAMASLGNIHAVS